MERLVLTWKTDLDACLRVWPDCMEVDPLGDRQADPLQLSLLHGRAVPRSQPPIQGQLRGRAVLVRVQEHRRLRRRLRCRAGNLRHPQEDGLVHPGEVARDRPQRPGGPWGPAPAPYGIVHPSDADGARGRVLELDGRVIPTGVGGDPEIQVFNGFNRDEAKSEVGADGYVFAGFGPLAFNSRSLFDPWHEFEVLEMLDAQYLGGYNSLTMGTGAVLTKY
jgi:hypothetical protein